MSTLRVPSLQHMARNWRESPEQVTKDLVKLARNSPTFSYNPLFPAVTDLLVFKLPYEQVADGLRRGIKRQDVRRNLLSVLPFIAQHFRDEKPDFVQEVAPRFYPAGRDLLIPFTPPMLYQVGGKLNFPWFSFWRSNPLQGERLSLFVTCVAEMLAQDPDLEDAQIQILDFSVPHRGTERELCVIEAANIARLTDARKREMLDIFAEGLRQARIQLAEDAPKRPRNSDQEKRDVPPDHPDLFG